MDVRSTPPPHPQPSPYPSEVEAQTVLYFSVCLAIVNVIYNLYMISSAAEKNDLHVYDYIMQTLSVGVGHVPHIAALRAGEGTEFDFSQVEEDVLVKAGYRGMRRVCDAMIEGKAVEWICWSRCQYHVSAILDLGGESGRKGRWSRV